MGIEISPEQEQLNAHLKRIEQSDVFRRSKVNFRLISYLVDKCFNEQGRNSDGPKEYEIAVEFFQRDKNFNPAEGAFVRVYISNLRKKLESYYQDEGKNETFQITIPQGGYRLAFVTSESLEQTETPSVSIKKQQTYLYFAVSFAVLFLLSLTINFWWLIKPKINSYQPVQQHVLWQDLLSNNKPTLIVVGDLYMLSERDLVTNKLRGVREFNVNSDEELDSYFQQYPEKKPLTEKAKSAFLLKNSVFSLKYLMPLFNDKSQVDIRLVSELTPNDLRDNNLIYLGLYKSLGLLSGYLRGSNFELEKNKASLKHKSNEKTYQLQGEPSREYTDYGLFGKFVGPNNNLVYILAGFSDASVIQMAKYLTAESALNRQDFHQQFNQYQGQNYVNFELIFATSGYDRTDLGSEIVDSGVINSGTIW